MSFCRIRPSYRSSCKSLTIIRWSASTSLIQSISILSQKTSGHLLTDKSMYALIHTKKYCTSFQDKPFSIRQVSSRYYPLDQPLFALHSHLEIHTNYAPAVAYCSNVQMKFHNCVTAHTKRSCSYFFG